MNDDVMPPAKVFLRLRVPMAQMRAWETLYGFKEFTYSENGTLLAHYHGRPFPNKGMATSASVEYNNIMKRVVIGIILCFKPTVHPIRNFLFQFKRLADYLYDPHYFHTRYYAECPQELMLFVYRLLRRFGIPFDLAYGCGRIPAQVLQQENAYRLRVEDIAGMTTKEKMLADPRGELKRIEKIYLTRELYKGEYGVDDKFKMVFKLLRLLLLIPKFKKAFKFALVDSDFKNFQLDKIDSYWANRFNDYNYNGETRGIRQLKQAFQLYAS